MANIKIKLNETFFKTKTLVIKLELNLTEDFFIQYDQGQYES